MTINNPNGFRVYRPSENDPDGGLAWRSCGMGSRTCTAGRR